MSRRRGLGLLGCAALIAVAAPARAVMVSHAANLSTSKGNPVTHVLILESDGARVHGAFHSDVPGRGTVVIVHEAPFQPTRSLIIGLTEGRDTDGTDKTQLVMLLDPAFAAARVGVPFSSVFPGARHSETIGRLLAAADGDAAELAWFTDTFFSGPAAGAAFATGGALVVAEFTVLKPIGQNATAGNWMITSFQSVSPGQSGAVTAEIGETAKVDLGPFDIELDIEGSLLFPGRFAIDKTVLNDTGRPITRFVLELGSGVGNAFVPSTPGDGLGFDAGSDNRDDSGAFPDVVVAEDRMTFLGLLPAGQSARLIAFVAVDTPTSLITIRQLAFAVATSAPAMGALGLALLATGLASLAYLSLRRMRARTAVRADR